jgi:hypothetical protein
MIFYNTGEVSFPMLIDSMFGKLENSKILDLYFDKHNNFKEIDDALIVIEKKRKTLRSHMLSHSFLSIKLRFDDSKSESEVIAATRKLSDNINSLYDDDLYIIALTLKSDTGKIESFLAVSDIEKTPEVPTTYYMSEHSVARMASWIFPEYHIKLDRRTDFYFSPLNDDMPLAYTGVSNAMITFSPKEQTEESPLDCDNTENV